MIRRTTMALCAMLAVVFLIGSICQAQEAKFAFVDFQKFGTMSQKAKEQQKKFGDMVEGKRTALESKRKELVDLQEQIQKQGPLLDEKARNQKVKEISVKEVEFKLAEKEAQNAVQNAQRDFQEVFRQDITKVIQAIRAEKRFTAIFDSAALLSADDSLDITAEVAHRYDAEAGKTAGPPATAPKPKAPAPAPAAAPKPKAPGAR